MKVAEKSHVTTAEKLAFLIRPEVYPDQPSSISVKETHMSWVFLSKDLVYKLKKPVKMEYLDFSTLEKRYEDCHQEVLLNRRLAPEVYLGTAPLVLDDYGNLSLEGEGVVVEWLVKMKRLPPLCMLDEQVQTGMVNVEALKKTAIVLSRFYSRQKKQEIELSDMVGKITYEVEENYKVLERQEYELDKDLLKQIHWGILTNTDRQKPVIKKRIEQGRVVDGHGDLRPEHICLLHPSPVVIDCLEFNSYLREVDTADELAFLSMECEALGNPGVGETIINAYCHHSGDGIEKNLLDMYKSKRAFLRAKLAISHLDDHPEKGTASKWRKKTGLYLELAAKYTGIGK